MSLQRFVRREIAAQRERLVGTVLTNPKLVAGDGSGTRGIFVVDVEVGSNRILRNVLVKPLGHSRFYAQLGQTVELRRTAQGRLEVIGPGDRLSGTRKKIEYTLATGQGGTPSNRGFTFSAVAFSFYATADLSAPLDVLWADGLTPFNLVRILDADGNPIP